MEQINQNLDELDKQIEAGEIEPPEGFYAPGIFDAFKFWLNETHNLENIQKPPRGKAMPVFSMDEASAIIQYLIYKPKGSFVFLPDWDYFKTKKEDLNEKGEIDPEKIRYTPQEMLILFLQLLYEDGYKKINPAPKFTLKEMMFLRDLIFNRPKGLLYFYIADHWANYDPLFPLSAVYFRRLKWLNHFIGGFNATKAARSAGFSSKCAKQQGHRILRAIQGFRRQGDKFVKDG